MITTVLQLFKYYHSLTAVQILPQSSSCLNITAVLQLLKLLHPTEASLTCIPYNCM